ncbi:MAG: hypothetical protein M1823_005959 [Watsoniomyces obsoletus]|nr:MAG: hypothetical protein M1823_005959 [Watsoniomyces obsoletus]
MDPPALKYCPGQLLAPRAWELYSLDQIYKALCPQAPLPKPRLAVTRTLYDPTKPRSRDSILDPGALILFFPGPRSVTGEDVLELHVHGGRALVQAVLAAIPRALGSDSSDAIRYAEPGEFTRRAFLNDRLDLTQVEALGDTLAAVTEQQRRLSVRGATGGATKRYEAWRQLLLLARGKLEALIDFSDDQDLDESPASLMSSVTSDVLALRTQIRVYRENAVRGEMLRNGITLSLLGAPNVGKSSLLNRIVGREAAIVSREAGTTRDVIEAGIDIGGWYCRIGDMAGIRLATGNSQSVGEVEMEGIKRAKQKALESDVIVVVLSAEVGPGGDIDITMNSDVMGLAARRSQETRSVIVIVNKVDRFSWGEKSVLPNIWIEKIIRAIPNLPRNQIFGTSCHLAGHMAASEKGPGGIQALLNGLVGVFRQLTSPVMPQGSDHRLPSLPFDDPSAWEESVGASHRQRLLLDACLCHLDDFLSHPFPGGAEREVPTDVVLAAECLRAAADCLGQITGRGQAGDVEEVLGLLFEKCVIRIRIRRSLT